MTRVRHIRQSVPDITHRVINPALWIYAAAIIKKLAAKRIELSANTCRCEAALALRHGRGFAPAICLKIIYAVMGDISAADLAPSNNMELTVNNRPRRTIAFIEARRGAFPSSAYICQHEMMIRVDMITPAARHTIFRPCPPARKMQRAVTCHANHRFRSRCRQSGHIKPCALIFIQYPPRVSDCPSPLSKRR